MTTTGARMVTVTIDVTQGDIDAGCKIRAEGKGCGGNCPVWWAVARALPGLTGPWVTDHSICQSTGEGIYDLDPVAGLPDEAQLFILSFDGGIGPLEPFSFTVTVPQQMTTARGGAPC